MMERGATVDYLRAEARKVYLSNPLHKWDRCKEHFATNQGAPPELTLSEKTGTILGYDENLASYMVRLDTVSNCWESLRTWVYRSPLSLQRLDGDVSTVERIRNAICTGVAERAFQELFTALSLQMGMLYYDFLHFVDKDVNACVKSLLMMVMQFFSGTQDDFDFVSGFLFYENNQRFFMIFILNAFVYQLTIEQGSTESPLRASELGVRIKAYNEMRFKLEMEIRNGVR